MIRNFILLIVPLSSALLEAVGSDGRLWLLKLLHRGFSSGPITGRRDPHKGSCWLWGEVGTPQHYTLRKCFC